MVILALSLVQSVAELRHPASVKAQGVARVIAGPRLSRRREQAAELARVQTARPAATAKPTTQLQTMLGEAGMQERHRALSASVLGLLDPVCQDRLRTFSVLYDHPQHRGLAGNGVILLSGLVPDKEFLGLLMHEGLGHFWDITCLTGTPASGASAFRDGDMPVWNDDPSVAFYLLSWSNERTRKTSARPEDFVTGYAYQGDNFEDLAESVTYFLTQRSAFEERAKSNPVLAAKLTWLQTHVPHPSAIATGGAWDGSIAWDATKMAFEMRD
jgi:hypothetical protein